jgi:translation initiation factor 2A
MIGGFGNLSKGEMDFWNLPNSQKKEIGKGKSPCATKVDWSACGRYILSSTLYERLKVDNGFMIFRGNGSKVLAKFESF